MTLVPDYLFIQNLYPVTATCFASISSGDYLITGDEKGVIKLWDLVSYKKSFLMEAHEGKIISIQCDPDFKLIVTQSRGVIKIWSFTGPPLNLQVIKIYPTSVISLSTCCLFPLDCGNYLIACCSPADSKIVNLHHSYMDSVISVTSPTSNQSGLLMVIKLVCFKVQNQIILLTGYESGVLKCHQITLNANENISSEQEVSSLSLFNEMITTIDFDDSSLKGICGSVGSKLIIFTISDPNCADSPLKMRILKCIDIGNQGISSVTIRSDYRLLCVSCWDSRVKLFSWRTLKLLAVLDKHKQSINSISFSVQLLNCKKMLLAVASNDKTVSLWSPYNNI